MRLSPALALCALTLLGAAPIPGQPPLDPAGETPFSPQATPQADCVADALKAIAPLEGRLTRTLVTRTRRWGEVWRADFDTPQAQAGLTNRIVCAGDMQIALNQQMAPLPVTSGVPGGVRCLYMPLENPCRGDPVQMLQLCVRPGLYLFPDGSSEPAGGEIGVSAANHGPPESDAQWAARCAPRGGVLRPEDLP